MITIKNYIQGYRNLCEQYCRIQSEFKKISFQDPTLEEIRSQIAAAVLPENDNMLANLRDIHKEIKPKVDNFEERMHIFKEELNSDKPLSIQAANASASELMLCRLRFDLEKIIRDIKLECLMDDKDEILFQIIDTAHIDNKDNDNTLLLEATSQPLIPRKIIKKLLELGADPFIKCRFNETPFSKAVSQNNLEFAKLYLDYKIHSLEERREATMLNPLRKLLEAPNAKIFYEELAKDLQDKTITDILEIDSDVTQKCLVNIGGSYEGLGYDSSIIGDDPSLLI